MTRPIIQTSNPNKTTSANITRNRTIYYGKVVDIDDPIDGGRIRAYIEGLDNRISNENLQWAYPISPKHIHIYPKKGEYVRILLEDNQFTQRSRFWEGPIISQMQKIEMDSEYTALSTTNLGLTNPEKAISTFPDADGVFPNKEDIALIGRVNTDIILRLNEVQIRAGKHENDNLYKLNIKNPASINMNYESISKETYQSNTIIQSDKIALISHSGNPNFKTTRMTPEDRQRIFEEGHPVARADVLVEALEVIRATIINHIHGYSGLPADNTALIKKLENLQFNQIMQENIVIN